MQSIPILMQELLSYMDALILTRSEVAIFAGVHACLLQTACFKAVIYVPGWQVTRLETDTIRVVFGQ
jgi:hypothetical protein